MKNKNEVILILHGWGLSGAKYKNLKQILEQGGYKTFAPDLPGFGQEPLKNNSMHLDDYVDFVRTFIKNNIHIKLHHAKKIFIIGHSFGGRVALKYVWKYPTEISGLILSGTPIYRDESFIKKIAYFLAIFGGKILNKFSNKFREKVRKFLYFMIGEWDYYNAGALKQVFKNIIGEELFGYLKTIKVPCVLIWGEKDVLVPVYNLQKIKKNIPSIYINIVQNAGHKLPYEKSEIFADKVIDFVSTEA